MNKNPAQQSSPSKASFVTSTVIQLEPKEQYCDIDELDSIDQEVQIIDNPKECGFTDYEGFEDDENHESKWFKEALKKQKRYLEEDDLIKPKKPEKILVPVQQYRLRRIRNQDRKSFNEQEYRELRDYFQIMHNQEEDPQQYSEQPRQPPITNRQLADKYNCHMGTINGLYKEWRYDPTFSRQLSKFNRVFRITRRSKAPVFVTAQEKTARRLDQLVQIIEQNPFLNIRQMVKALAELDPIENSSIEKAVVSRLIAMGEYRKRKLQKVSKTRNSAENIELRRQFALKFQDYLKLDFPVYIYDELLIHQHFAETYGWARGDSEVQFRPQDKIDESIVILGLMSRSGSLLWDAKYGNYSESEFKATVTRFFNAVVNQSNRRGVVIVNSVSYRQMSPLYEAIREISWQILPLPPQSLQLNPFHSYYTDFKEHIRKVVTFDSVQGLFADVVTTLQARDGQEIGQKYILKLDSYVQMAIAREKF